MACHAARRLGPMNENLSQIIGIELLTSAQGIELRQPLTTSMPLQGVTAKLRATVPALNDDRFMATDIKTASDIIRTDTLIEGLPGLHLKLPPQDNIKTTI